MHITPTRIRFIGYCLFTGPEMSGDSPGAESYLGNDNLCIDISSRILILKNAVDLAKSQLPSDEDPSQVINVFLAPEFYFHGTQGPYVYSNEDEDPLPFMLSMLSETFNRDDYPNWTFVFGTAVTAKVANLTNLFESESVCSRNSVVRNLVAEKMKTYGASNQLIAKTLSSFIVDCQASPNLIVRDRAVIVSAIALDSISESLQSHAMTSEKYYLSPEDFVLCEPTGKNNVVTEQMVAYEHIDLSNGDLKRTPFDEYAIFRQNFGDGDSQRFVDYGVEICLDHDDARLRSNLAWLPEKDPKGSVQVQLIPSYGSAIIPANVVAKVNGFVFNCDGQMRLDSSDGVQQYGGEGMQMTYINFGTDCYGAHSQFALVQTPASGNNPKLNTATFQDIDAANVVVFAVSRPVLKEGVFEDYYCGGFGAIHVYGLQQPYTLPTSASVN